MRECTMHHVWPKITEINLCPQGLNIGLNPNYDRALVCHFSQMRCFDTCILLAEMKNPSKIQKNWICLSIRWTGLKYCQQQTQIHLQKANKMFCSLFRDETLVRVQAQVMTRDDSSGGWVPMGGGGLSYVGLVRRQKPGTEESTNRKHEYLIYGQRIADNSVSSF